MRRKTALIAFFSMVTIVSGIVTAKSFVSASNTEIVEKNKDVVIEMPKPYVSEDITVYFNIAPNIAKLEVKTNDRGSWMDVTESKKIKLSQNGTMSLQATYKDQTVIESKEDVEIFDKEAPIIRATINANLLTIGAEDALSGISSAYVNGNIFENFKDGQLVVDVKTLKDYESSEFFIVTLSDKAGNRTREQVENPFHQKNVKAETKINLKVPEGYYKGEVKIPVEVLIEGDNPGITIEKIEAKIDNGKFFDITEKKEVVMTTNGNITIQATDNKGTVTNESKSVNFFDKEKPLITASFVDKKIKVHGIDGESGIQNIFINEKSYPLAENNLEIAIDSIDGGINQQVFVIYGVDKQGNRSDGITLHNPEFKVQATIEQKIIKSEQSQSAVNNTVPEQTQPSTKTSAVPGTQSTIATPPVIESKDNSLVDAPKAVESTSSSAVSDQVEKGNATVVEESSEGQKDFVTFKTKEGNSYYLIIDNQKNNDNVYLLRQINENDLTEGNSTSNVGKTTPVPEVKVKEDPIKEEVEESTTKEKTTKPEEEKIPEQKSSSNWLFMLVIAVLGAGGYVAFKKFKERENYPDDEVEFDDEEEGEYERPEETVEDTSKPDEKKITIEGEGHKTVSTEEDEEEIEFD